MAKPTLHFQRFEFKYFLPRSHARPLVSALRPHMIWDPYGTNGQGWYRVNSLYYDTPGFDCFWDKEAGVADRKKLRLRYYGDTLSPDTEIYAELKRKQNELVIKDRVNLRLGDAGGPRLQKKFLDMHKANRDNEFMQEIAWFTRRNSLRPKIFISYIRYALLSKRNREFRVTVDENIESREQFDFISPPGHAAKIYQDGVVVEVKFNNVLPGWFHPILQKFNLQRLAYSKYGNSIRHLIPVFDDNNYKLV